MVKKKRIQKVKTVECKTGTVAEFLGLTPAQNNYVEMKVALINALKFFRIQKGRTQAQLAKLIKSSQSRVAKMEAGDPSVSFDLLIKAILSLDISAEELLKHLLKEINPFAESPTILSVEPIVESAIAPTGGFAGFIMKKSIQCPTSTSTMVRAGATVRRDAAMSAIEKTFPILSSEEDEPRRYDA